ncbi:MAG: NAD(P)-dependent alcohol dehydrogenase [Chitinophagales bacterium]|nr:NAD(P)-dependent alcohol dehydrogenase [Chitinophagales bacterium]MBP9705918.1 NAD(P)-dependent alcohol dehydrogenase [Chitinophagales bacterium]
MKAAIYNHYGPPDVVSIQEMDKPIPKEDEILIKVIASTVNRTDTGLRSAQYFISRFFTGLFKPKYKVLGNEFAGVIEQIGSSVSSFKIGDRIFGFNDTHFGGHAEYMIVREADAIATIPDTISFIEAACITEGAHYALVDIRAAKVQSRQNVMVYGATGAIGSAAVQLLKHFGAHVTAVCNTKNVDLVKSLGADVVIDYMQEDFTQTQQKFDFVFDAVGKTSFGKCKPILTKKGIYISTELGKNSENVFYAIITQFAKGKRVLFPIPTITKEDVIFLKELVISGEFKPVIDRHFPLDNIMEAHTYVESGQKTGNVIIDIAI